MVPQISGHAVPLVPAGSVRQAADLGSGQPLHRRRLPGHVLRTRPLPAELLPVSVEGVSGQIVLLIPICNGSCFILSTVLLQFFTLLLLPVMSVLTYS